MGTKVLSRHDTSVYRGTKEKEGRSRTHNASAACAADAEDPGSARDGHIDFCGDGDWVDLAAGGSGERVG